MRVERTFDLNLDLFFGLFIALLSILKKFQILFGVFSVPFSDEPGLIGGLTLWVF